MGVRVYPYATEGRGVVELETDNAVVPNGHSQGGNGTAAGTFPSQAMWYNQFELTYGITDRIEAAAYLNLALPRGGGYQYANSNYRLRGRLFDEDVSPVNLGWYVELEWHRTPQFDTDQLELELRPIREKDLGRFSILANPIFEKPILVGPDKNEGFQFGYSGAVYYRWMRVSLRRESRSTARPATSTTLRRSMRSSSHLSGHLGRAPVSRRIQRRTGASASHAVRPRNREIQPQVEGFVRFRFSGPPQKELVFLERPPANQREEAGRVER